MKDVTSKQFLADLVKHSSLQTLYSVLGEKAELHLVGGTVRDALLGKRGTDVDLATVLLPDEVRSKLTESNIHVVPTGLKHQTVTAVVDNRNIEITTFRGEGMTPEGGVVSGKTVLEDLPFRDFTINAMAFAFNSLELIDPLNGAEELKNKVLRACGDPEQRFSEDPLRLLRAVRIATQLGLTIDSATKSAIINLAPALAKVSVERMREELNKILVSPAPRIGFSLLLETGLLEIVLPEIMPAVDCEQNSFHKADVFRHTLDVLENAEPELVLRLASLFHDIGKPHTISLDEVTGERHFYKHETVGAEMTKETMKRLRYSNDLTESVAMLVQTHMRPIEVGAPGLRRILRDTGAHFETWRKLKEADTLATNIDPLELAQRLAVFDEKVAEVKKGPELSPLASLAIKGSDLLELGFNEGPQIGVILRALHEKVLDAPELNTREQLLELSKELIA